MGTLVSVQPTAKVIFIAVLLLFMVVQLRVAGAGLLRHQRTRTTGVARLDRGSLLLVTATTGLGIGAAFIFAANVPSMTIGAGVSPVRWLCFAVGVTAIASGVPAALASARHPRARLPGSYAGAGVMRRYPMLRMVAI